MAEVSCRADQGQPFRHRVGSGRRGGRSCWCARTYAILRVFLTCRIDLNFIDHTLLLLSDVATAACGKPVPGHQSCWTTVPVASTASDSARLSIQLYPHVRNDPRSTGRAPLRAPSTLDAARLAGAAPPPLAAPARSSRRTPRVTATRRCSRSSRPSGATMRWQGAPAVGHARSYSPIRTCTRARRAPTCPRTTC